MIVYKNYRVKLSQTQLSRMNQAAIISIWADVYVDGKFMKDKPVYELPVSDVQETLEILNSQENEDDR